MEKIKNKLTNVKVFNHFKKIICKYIRKMQVNNPYYKLKENKYLNWRIQLKNKFFVIVVTSLWTKSHFTNIISQLIIKIVFKIVVLLQVYFKKLVILI